MYNLNTEIQHPNSPGYSMEVFSFESYRLVSPLEPSSKEPGEVEDDPPEETSKKEVVDEEGLEETQRAAHFVVLAVSIRTWTGRSVSVIMYLTGT